MNPRTGLLTYRVLLRGEGLGQNEEWIGFFATRQLRAESEAKARTEAVSAILDSWPQEAEGLISAVKAISPIEAKQVRVAWLKRPRGGFTFFNDDDAAEVTAQRIERRASGF